MYINCIRALVLNWLFWALSTSFIPTIAGCTFVCIRSCYMGQMIAFLFFFTHFNSYPRSAACYAFLSPAFFANANRCWCLIDQGEHLIFFITTGSCFQVPFAYVPIMKSANSAANCTFCSPVLSGPSNAWARFNWHSDAACALLQRCKCIHICRCLDGTIYASTDCIMGAFTRMNWWDIVF